MGRASDGTIVFATVQAPTTICATCSVFVITRVKLEAEAWESLGPMSSVFVHDLVTVGKSFIFIFQFINAHVFPYSLASCLLLQLTSTRRTLVMSLPVPVLSCPPPPAFLPSASSLVAACRQIVPCQGFENPHKLIDALIWQSFLVSPHKNVHPQQRIRVAYSLPTYA